MDKNKYIQEFISDSDIKKFIVEHKIDLELINNNFYKFYDLYNSNKICRECKGLENCPHSIKGLKDSLIYTNDYLESCKEKCKYLLDKENNDNKLSNFVYCDIYPSELKLNNNNIEIDKDNKLLLTEISNIIKGNRTTGFYLWGDFGVGKSYICSIFANEMVKLNKKVAYLRVNDFINNLRDIRINDNSEYRELLTKIKKADLVIFDDIGAETVTEFSRDDVLFNILDYRMENKLMTIFISNLNKDKSENNSKSLLEHFIYDNKGNKSENNASRLMERINCLAKETILLKGTNKRNM